jgi:hypothetical protein
MNSALGIALKEILHQFSSAISPATHNGSAVSLSSVVIKNKKKLENRRKSEKISFVISY